LTAQPPLTAQPLTRRPGSGLCEVCGAWAWQTAPDRPPRHSTPWTAFVTLPPRGPAVTPEARRAITNAIAEAERWRTVTLVALAVGFANAASAGTLLGLNQEAIQDSFYVHLIAWPGAVAAMGLLLTTPAVERWLYHRRLWKPLPGGLFIVLALITVGLLIYVELTFPPTPRVLARPPPPAPV